MRIIKKQLAKGTRFETPYYLIRGNVGGSTVIITAGVHGNERASVIAANKLVRLLKTDSLQLHIGTLIIVPIVNQAAYKKRVRGVPDLNRTFPRNVNNKARHPLSAALFRLAVDLKPDWYIDLHEANGLSKLNPSVLGQTFIANPGNHAVPTIKRIARRMNRSITASARHFTIRLRTLSGSGRHAASRLLKSKSVTVETCWSLPISTRVHFQSRILRYLLQASSSLNSK